VVEFGTLLGWSAGPGAGSENGTYGFDGAKTERVTIESISYWIIRGYEPYEAEDFGENHVPWAGTGRTNCYTLGSLIAKY
jgi:hypothetical protein